LSLPFLASFVINPTCLRRLNILVLAFLRTAADQNHNPFVIAAEVNAVARAEVDRVFKQAGADALGIRRNSIIEPLW
jgi:hypothetical protein